MVWVANSSDRLNGAMDVQTVAHSVFAFLFN